MQTRKPIITILLLVFTTLAIAGAIRIKVLINFSVDPEVNSFAVYQRVNSLGVKMALKPKGTRFFVTFKDGVTQRFIKKDGTSAGMEAEGPADEENKREQPCEGTCDSPLLIDLEKDGIHLGTINNIVSFDLLGNGERNYHWVRKGENDAFLAIDLNENGIIDDGTELFGQGTDIFGFNRKAHDGFEALSQYDFYELGGNSDNRITKRDRVWSKLLVWLDSNADGISTDEELFRLEEVNIKAIKLNYSDYKSQDAVGNVIYKRSWVRFNNESDFKKSRIVDVFFKRIE